MFELRDSTEAVQLEPGVRVIGVGRERQPLLDELEAHATTDEVGDERDEVLQRPSEPVHRVHPQRVSLADERSDRQDLGTVTGCFEEYASRWTCELPGR